MEGYSSFNNLIYIIFILTKNATKYLWYQNDMKFIKDLTYEIEKFNIVYVKILQAICINSFIFNKNQIDYLIKYTDQVPYTASDVNLDFIEQFKEKDLHITNTTPINSGIIALVYEGMYKEQRVAIKVIKNNIVFQLKNALDDVDFVCWLFSYIPFLKSFKLNQLYKHNREVIIDQVDFKLEMKNLREYKNMNKNLDYLDSPEVYEEFTNINSNVLVMEYVEGLKFADIKEEDKYEFCKIIAKIGYVTTLYHRINHCDLHSGNIFFVDGEKKKVIFIDFGIVCKISKEEQECLYNFFMELFINKDYCEAAKVAGKNLLYPPNYISSFTKEKQNTIYTNWGVILQKYWGDTLSVEFLPECNKFLDKYNLQMSPGFSKIQLSLASGVGLASELLHGDLKIQQKLMEDTLKEVYDLDVVSIPG